ATVVNIGFIRDHNNQPRTIENPAVVSRTFGPNGGQIWVSDEDYPDTVSTVPGAVHAIDPGGAVTLDVVEWHGAEQLIYIPNDICTFCNNGTLFQAITLNEQGQVGLYQYFPISFAGLSGDVLIPSESGQGTALVQFDGTNYVTSFFDNIPGGTFEGASFVDCNVPTPTPTFTPTPTSTVCGALGSCTPPYPFVSSSPRTNIAFNESEVLRAFRVSVTSDGCTPIAIQMFYNDEHAMTLGVRQTQVITCAGN